MVKAEFTNATMLCMVQIVSECPLLDMLSFELTLPLLLNDECMVVGVASSVALAYISLTPFFLEKPSVHTVSFFRNIPKD